MCRHYWKFSQVYYSVWRKVRFHKYCSQYIWWQFVTWSSQEGLLLLITVSTSCYRNWSKVQVWQATGNKNRLMVHFAVIFLCLCSSYYMYYIWFWADIFDLLPGMVKYILISTWAHSLKRSRKLAEPRLKRYTVFTVWVKSILALPLDKVVDSFFIVWVCSASSLQKKLG